MKNYDGQDVTMLTNCIYDRMCNNRLIKAKQDSIEYIIFIDKVACNRFINDLAFKCPHN